MRLPSAIAEGRLQIGLDVAGESNSGDKVAFAPRRGDRSYPIHAERGMTPERILVRAVDLLREHRQPGDVGDNRPIVCIDSDGSQGAKVKKVFEAYLHTREDAFELIAFRGSEKPKGTLAQAYKLNRDLLFGGLFAWFRDGGAICVDLMLEAELLELRSIDVEGGAEVLIRKDELRKRLHRSPDRADALALSTWREVHPFATQKDPTPEPPRAKQARPDAYEAEDARDDDLVYGDGPIYDHAGGDPVYGR